MGGGDLNLKKSWHPATFRNQEKVWKKEHEAEEERKKLEQLRREKETERQIQDLQRLSGSKKNVVERLDWIYAAKPNDTPELISEERESYLLGKRTVDSLLNSNEKPEESRIDFVCGDKSALYGLSANSSRDVKSKLMEDPLLAMRKKEHDCIQELLSNPVRLKSIKNRIHSHSRSHRRRRRT